MPGRRRASEGASWRRSLALSLSVHAAVLTALGVAATYEDRPAQWPGGLPPLADPVDTATSVEIAAAEVMLPPPPAPPVEGTPPPASAAPFGDRDNPLGSSLPRRPDSANEPRRQRPAPDRGAALGRGLEDSPWRRDASTLHERLSDGADRNQPSHARTGPTATSPQAVRREPVTGVGDSVRDARVRQPPPAPRYGAVDPADDGLGHETRESPGTADEMRPDRPVSPDGRTVLVASQGPLDSERGTRTFDVEQTGAAAADDRAARAASREAHPSITDLTLAAAPGASNAGRGPADEPGAVSRPSPGTAAVVPGNTSLAVGPGQEARTQERTYERYKQRVKERVDQALVFPRQLKVRLLQGETILRFVVRTDGHLGETVQVVKSSGFAEFDRAALDAVQKASPFGPMTDIPHAVPLVMNLLVTFPNPVIR